MSICQGRVGKKAYDIMVKSKFPNLLFEGGMDGVWVAIFTHFHIGIYM